MDLARFVGPRVAWFSPVSNVRAYIDLITISVASALSPCGGCGEAMHDMLWRRTGTRVHKWPLWAEVGRRGAACAGIIGCRAHVSNFSHHLRDPKYGNVWHFPPERECSGANDEHQLCASPATRPSLTKADGNGSCAQRLWPAAAPPHEWFPDCTDVDDLSVPWPLRPCKFRSPSATEHPVRVRRGYGKPFLPDAAELEQLRRNTSAMREAKASIWAGAACVSQLPPDPSKPSNRDSTTALCSPWCKGSATDKKSCAWCKCRACSWCAATLSKYMYR